MRSGTPALLPVTQSTAATDALPTPLRLPGFLQYHPTPCVHSQHRAAPGHPRKWQLSSTKPPNKAWASRSKPNCHEGDTTGGVGAGRQRSSTTPGRDLGKCMHHRASSQVSLEDSPPRSSHHPEPSSSPGVCQSFSLLPPSAALAPGRRREGAPWSAFQPPPEDDTGVREEGKFPGWKPFLFPSVLDCKCAGSALPF